MDLLGDGLPAAKPGHSTWRNAFQKAAFRNDAWQPK
jgi:hypothetical protein